MSSPLPADVVPELIQLVQVQWNSFSVKDAIAPDDAKLTGFGYFVNAKCESIADQPKLAGIYLSIQAQGQNQESEELPMHFDAELSFLFQVENLSEISEANTNENKLISHLEATLAGIAYSTARGLLMNKVQGTRFTGFILPVISPYRVLKGEYANDDKS